MLFLVDVPQGEEIPQTARPLLSNPIARDPQTPLETIINHVPAGLPDASDLGIRASSSLPNVTAGSALVVYDRLRQQHPQWDGIVRWTYDPTLDTEPMRWLAAHSTPAASTSRTDSPAARDYVYRSLVAWAEAERRSERDRLIYADAQRGMDRLESMSLANEYLAHPEFFALTAEELQGIGLTSTGELACWSDVAQSGLPIADHGAHVRVRGVLEPVCKSESKRQMFGEVMRQISQAAQDAFRAPARQNLQLTAPREDARVPLARAITVDGLNTNQSRVLAQIWTELVESPLRSWHIVNTPSICVLVYQHDFSRYSISSVIERHGATRGQANLLGCLVACPIMAAIEWVRRYGQNLQQGQHEPGAAPEAGLGRQAGPGGTMGRAGAGQGEAGGTARRGGGGGGGGTSGPGSSVTMMQGARRDPPTGRTSGSAMDEDETAFTDKQSALKEIEVPTATRHVPFTYPGGPFALHNLFPFPSLSQPDCLTNQTHKTSTGLIVPRGWMHGSVHLPPSSSLHLIGHNDLSNCERVPPFTSAHAGTNSDKDAGVQVTIKVERWISRGRLWDVWAGVLSMPSSCLASHRTEYGHKGRRVDWVEASSVQSQMGDSDRVAVFSLPLAPNAANSNRDAAVGMADTDSDAGDRFFDSSSSAERGAHTISTTPNSPNDICIPVVVKLLDLDSLVQDGGGEGGGESEDDIDIDAPPTRSMAMHGIAQETAILRKLGLSGEEDVRGKSIGPAFYGVWACGGVVTVVLERLEYPSYSAGAEASEAESWVGGRAAELPSEVKTAILDLYARLHDRGIVHVDVEMRHIMASQVSSLVRPRHANAAARTDGTPLVNQLSARPFDLRLIDFDQSWLLPASAVADPSEIAIYTKQEKAMVARLLEVDDGVWERLEMMERWAERERGREADSKLKAGGGLAEKAPRETGDDGLSSAQ